MSEDRSDSDQAPFDPSFHTVERLNFFSTTRNIGVLPGAQVLPEMKMEFEKTDPV